MKAQIYAYTSASDDTNAASWCLQRACVYARQIKAQMCALKSSATRARVGAYMRTCARIAQYAQRRD